MDFMINEFLQNVRLEGPKCRMWEVGQVYKMIEHVKAWLGTPDVVLDACYYCQMFAIPDRLFVVLFFMFFNASQCFSMCFLFLQESCSL